MKKDKTLLKDLINNIAFTHRYFQNQAAQAINRSLTIRNWLIGWHIVEFEQLGQAKAKYGTDLLNTLSKKLGIKGLVSAELSRCRQFYSIYPQILGTVSQELTKLPFNKPLLDQLQFKLNTASNPLLNQRNLSKSSCNCENLVNHLSFSHFVELIKIQEIEKRTFYETQCINGTWSVRELKRQINSLYFERFVMSSKPEKLKTMTEKNNAVTSQDKLIKSIYAFEFLGLNAQDAIEESDLESALLANIQGFLLELGHGFCLEARQKKLLIGDEYFFIDLVFYHRILKCHVLIELKVGAFHHYQIAQLNTYLNYFKQNVKEENDQPPIGILLVTNKNQALVEFATAGIDNQLFVSKYLLQLPQKDQLKTIIENEIQNWRNLQNEKR
jgi:predicted nuclease of restriction endonuclease-like (RecB) superfamily